jgi:hypothetical protein
LAEKVRQVSALGNEGELSQAERSPEVSLLFFERGKGGKGERANEKGEAFRWADWRRT